MFDLIAFDADDTLWHNETIFRLTQDRFRQMFSAHHSEDWLDKQLLAVEVENLQYFGYGIKGFTLSLIETAIMLTEGNVTGAEIQQIIDLAKEMTQAPVEPLPSVEQVLQQLSPHYELMVLTKGDLLDQESKLARSGLANYFTHVEVVSHKTSEVYGNLLERYHIPPERFLMIGNSLKSDVLPVIECGAYAIHVPYTTTWAHEMVPASVAEDADYIELDNIAQLPQLLERLYLA